MVEPKLHNWTDKTDYVWCLFAAATDYSACDKEVCVYLVIMHVRICVSDLTHETHCDSVLEQ